MASKWTRMRLLGLSLLILAGALNARTACADAPTPEASSAAKDTLGAVQEVTGKLGLLDTITVQVEDLKTYLSQPGRDYTKLVLYLDWRPIKGLTPQLIPDTNKLQFSLARTPESKEQWDALMSRPFSDSKSFTYNVAVSVGYENEKPAPSDIRYPLIVVKQTWFWVFAVLFVFVLVLFVWLARSSSIIRDPSPGLPNRDKPFSLGRTQMAFWFFVVIISYVLIWMITGDREAISGSALGLLGISAATGLGAAVVGSSKLNSSVSKRQDLELEQATLSGRLDELKPQIAADPAPASLNDLTREQAEKAARLDQVSQEIQALVAAAAPIKTEGFLNDILTDSDGISLYRFQMAIWTVVLGFIFAAAVYYSLAMPQFNDTLLALMGISGGTYVGFKFPEKQS
jgi:hypothetical protein